MDNIVLDLPILNGFKKEFDCAVPYKLVVTDSVVDNGLGSDSSPSSERCSSTDEESNVSVRSSAFDEGFQVNEEEEVKTPRTQSPTLSELKRDLLALNRNSKISNVNGVCLTTTHDVPIKPTKLLSDVYNKLCPYPIDRRYDEYVIPRKRGSKCIRLPTDGLTEMSNIGARLFGNHGCFRKLDNFLPCPSSPIPRQTSYSSSSGSLIGNLNELNFPPAGDILCASIKPNTPSDTCLSENSRGKTIFCLY